MHITNQTSKTPVLMRQNYFGNFGNFDALKLFWHFSNFGNFDVLKLFWHFGNFGNFYVSKLFQHFSILTGFNFGILALTYIILSGNFSHGYCFIFLIKFYKQLIYLIRNCLTSMRVHPYITLLIIADHMG